MVVESFGDRIQISAVTTDRDDDHNRVRIAVKLSSCIPDAWGEWFMSDNFDDSATHEPPLLLSYTEVDIVCHTADVDCALRAIIARIDYANDRFEEAVKTQTSSIASRGLLPKHDDRE